MTTWEKVRVRGQLKTVGEECFRNRKKAAKVESERRTLGSVDDVNVTQWDGSTGGTGY